MFEIILAAFFGALKVAGMVTFAYLFYWRVIDYAHCVWFYSKQGRDACILTPGHMPMLGNIIQVVKSMLKSRREGDNYHVMQHVVDGTVP